MHCRGKEHVSKFNSKSRKVQVESAFIKHLENSHDGKEEGKDFQDYFEFEILKTYSKAFTMCVEEGTLIASHEGEILNSKSEWHQSKVIRTNVQVVQGGAEVGREQGRGGRGGGRDDRAGQGRPGRAWGQ